MLTKFDISQIRTVVREELSPIDSRLGKVETRLEKVEKSLRKIDKKVDLTIRLFDGDYIKPKKRVDRIENKVFA